MNDATSPTLSLAPPPESGAPSGSPADRGLRSSQGIRWLLLAGALVCGVSVYRLVQAQWDFFPAPLQFLILVAGSLAIYGLGSLTRRRLHLPYAGSALLSLFAGLVPVLSWGAAYLNLLQTASGWMAFGAGLAVLLGASRRVLMIELGYRGRLYPAILGVLLAAQAALPWLAERLPGAAQGIYLATALLLGGLLHVGSLHVNRFFFHRDRRDGVERPLHFIPFVVLGLLYAGAMLLLAVKSAFLALPLAVVGIVLAATGEEYYQALARSRGAAPENWPRRSVALIAVGLALLAGAVPLALRESTGLCMALVSLGAALYLLRWSLRYRTAGLYAAGLVAAFFAYTSSPALLRPLAHWLLRGVTQVTGLSSESPALFALGQLGFLALLVLGAAWLRRIDVPEQLRRVHAVAVDLHLAVITGLALTDPAGSLLVLPFALALSIAGILLGRRIELLALYPAPAAALVLAMIRAWSSEPDLFNKPGLCALGIATLASVLASRFAEGPLARLLAVSAERIRKVLLVPALVTVALLFVDGLLDLFGVVGLSGVELLLAGAVLSVVTLRLGSAVGFVGATLLLSLGAHVSLYHVHPSWTGMALLTQALFVLSWLAGRRRETVHGPGAEVSAICHAILGLIWMGQAVLGAGAGIEPLILPLVGLALLDEGLRDRRRDLTPQGLGLLAAFPLVQIGLTSGFASPGPWLLGHIAAAAVLAVLILAARRGLGARIARRLSLAEDTWRDLILRSLAGLVHLWGAAAVVLCLIFAGPEALALAAVLVVLVFLARLDLAARATRAALPLRPSLLLILQLAALPGSFAESFLPAALLSQGFGLLPLAAGLVLSWRFLGDTLGRRWTLEPWGTVAEGMVATGYLAALFFAVRPDLAVVLAVPPALATFQHLVLITVAMLWALLSFTSGRRSRRESDAWAMQAWAGLALAQAFTAGWLTLGSAATPYILLVAGVGLYALAQLLGRTDLRAAFSGPCRTSGLLLPLAAGLLALHRAWSAPGATVWFPALAAFLVSLFYLIVASREARRVFPSLASAGLLGLALLAVVARTQLGTEFYSLAPGLTLLTLAWLLRTELGAAWSRHVVAAGASCLYATPIVALADQISWGWLAALLLLAMAFGAASFGLRSRSLLTVSTAALLTDLGFFVFRIGATAPTVLWALGALFGLAVMGAAAYLEYQREGVLQQIRVFGRDLRAWS
jgi:hypothetical protein